MATSLPQSFYRAEQVREGEQAVAQTLNIPMYQLMLRAGQAVFDSINQYYPNVARLLIVCGAGNNAGDGYVIARLAKSSGLNVTVWSLVDPNKLSGDAATAWQEWTDCGGDYTKSQPVVAQFDVIVDAILGTGLSRTVEGDVAEAITAVNQSQVPIVAVDIPSGLCANSGYVKGVAVNADITVTLIALKQGLLTGQAVAHRGELIFAGLNVATAFARQSEPAGQLIRDDINDQYLPTRSRSAHKGLFGRVLCLGGDHGMAGAITLSAQAALRTGAGLVKVVTQKDHTLMLVTRQPELMTQSWAPGQSLSEALSWATHLVIGPGLGNSAWSEALWKIAIASRRPKVIDADGLNKLARQPQQRDDWILTPHPGEAARLLGCDVDDVELDRFAAVKAIQTRYGGVAVLKGAGTIVYDGTNYAVANVGNPGMASGGMGDILSGVIASLLAQGVDLFSAAALGCYLHGKAGDHAARAGERGLLASDLLPHLQQLVD
ncbi:bifunctional ADP-dependent NAD(P)H-hydrate dehydratase/NAD(P)H-hydrate epimerase [Salinivibrio sp. ES.052]|uniref:bifunctional ADP-dependent NAD(P)H-hydrate dehydratase/NAD(P)H-hydrate epimerase n=1 Tax=Salinivibrio sp. ES.052 TaxID=1882823 RepID=UPI0009267898|nr:bifunctional ADP-dependent NAD(P)H-hydrate dehydratase/NAD(P)H-hydrate epimerase [Salinivibrio sp. ES.052]SIO26068.1 NAD(P)H-hydrate epimerase [Salinivibrio sp. ES.052]